MRRARFSIVIVVALWTLPAHALTVGVVRPSHLPAITAEVLVRLFAELQSLGLQPRTLDVPDIADGPPAQLAELARESSADAVIAIPGGPLPTGVAVWAADGKGRSVTRRVSVDAEVGRVPQTIAIRAIELLRSCLLELDLLAPPAAEKVAPPKQPSPSPSPSPAAPGEGSDVRASGTARSRLGLAAGALLLLTTDGVGPALLPCLRLDWRVGSGWLLHAQFAGLGTAGAVNDTAGSARVEEDQALFGITYRSWPERRVRPLLGLSAGALRTAVEGDALPLYDSQRVARWSFLVDGAAGASLRLASRWDLVAAAHVQAAAPYPAVRFLGQTVGTAAHPSWLFGVALEVWL